MDRLLASQLRKFNGASRQGGFHFVSVICPAVALKAGTDGECRSIEIDVVPGEATHFALTKAQAKRHVIESLQAIVLNRVQRTGAPHPR